MSHWFLPLLQMTDGTFPTGSFSHSFGLETAIDCGRVYDRETLLTWLRSYLEGSLEPCDLRAIAIVRAEVDQVGDVDATLAAMIFASEVRAGLRRMTVSMLNTFAAIGFDDLPLAAYRSAVMQEGAFGHPAVALGLASRAIQAPVDETLQAYGALALGALASAAARAMPLGQRDLARVRATLHEPLARSAERAARARRCVDLAAWAFAQEIDALSHRRLTGRLFAS